MGLSLRNIGKKLSDIAGGLERQINPLDAGLSYKTKIASPQNKQQNVIQQAGHLAGTVVKPVIQLPVQSAENYSNTFANLGNRVGGGGIQPIQTNMGGNPLLNKTLQFSGATGRTKQLAGDVAQIGLMSVAPGISRGIEAPLRVGLARLATPKIVAKVLPRVVSNASLAGGFNASAAAGQGANFGQTAKAFGQGAALGGAVPVAGEIVKPVVKLTAQTIDNRVPLNAVGGGQPFDNRVGQVITSIPEGKTSITQKLKKGLIDKDQVILDQLRSIEKQTGQKGLVNEFMYNSNMTRGSNAIANQTLTHSPNIQTAIGGLNKKQYGQFSDYANDRTELDSALSKKTPTGRQAKVRTSAPIEQLRSNVLNAPPDFHARFDALNTHYKELATVARDAGLIDKPTYARYTANNNYIRLQRDMGDLLPDAFGQGKSYSLGSTILKQKRTGSQRATLPAGETAANYTQQVYREAARNKTGTQLMDTLNQHGLAERLPSAKAARHQNVIKIIRGGKTEYYKVSPQMKEAVQNINPYHMNAVMQILAIPGRVLRAGVTGLNPVFIARNLIKDQAGSAINSEHLLNTHNPASFFSGLYNATKGSFGAKNTPEWQNFLQHYGDQTSYDLTRNVKNTQNIVNEIRGGTKYKVFDAAKNPMRSLENIAQITEKSTRFQNFRGAYKKAIDEGLSHEAASEKAAIQAWQNSVDFSRAGEWGRVINTVIPYWNPATQGVRQMGRTFTKHPIKSSFTGAAILGVPMAAATAWNLKNEDTKKGYDNISENEKENNLVLIPPGTKQNKDGTYDVVKIPLPSGYKDVFMPIRRAMEAFHHNKPLEANKIAQDILQATSGPIATQTKSQAIGSITPQGVKPFVQIATNRDLFTGNQTVPDYIQNATDAQGNPIPRPEQAFKNTSGTARLAANATNQSPIKIEKFVKDVGGTVATNLLNASDRLLASKGVIPKDQIGGQSISTGFKKSFTSTYGKENYNKSEGAKYYDRVTKIQKDVGLTGNELAAWNALHPSKKNFLGDQIYEADSTYNPAARLDVYNRYPKTFEVDKRLDAASPVHNPLYKLESWQVKKVLEKENLPPGADDKELNKLRSQDWYTDYSTQKSKYFTDIGVQQKADLVKAKASGDTEKAKSIQASIDKYNNLDNKYPVTPPDLQKIMDYYSSLPKGTGARSGWIKANPGQWKRMQDQFASIDNWQNIARGKRGLDTTEGSAGVAAGYDTSSGQGGYSKYSSSKSSGKTRYPSLSSPYGYTTVDPTLNTHKYAVSLSAGGKPVKAKKSSGKQVSLKGGKKFAVAKPAVTLKKSKV